jgi:aminocarboxymuconate-semialdehyde decarboxylase
MVNWAPAEFGLKLAQTYNDSLAKAHKEHPTRFVGMATLPMQAPELALKELERAAKLPGIRGAYMATHINGKNLDDESFFPLYARCEELGFPIFLHPVNPLAQERMSRYYLRNFLGNPYESGVAASCIMFGGVMDRFPRLEVMLPHAGGTFPWLIGRMTHGATVRAEVKHMKRPPSDYLRRFHYDTIGHSAQIIMNLIRLTGADRVVPVSDRYLILGGTAARLLRIT